MNDTKYLQDIWPENTCYGCGPGNQQGMQLKSRWSDDGRFLIAEYRAEEKYNAGMHDVMYGGTVASLIDCHSVWTAMAFAYKAEGLEMGDNPRFIFVTGELCVTYLKPTPVSKTVHLKAWMEGEIGRKIRVSCELGPQGDVTAKGSVIAVRVG